MEKTKEAILKRIEEECIKTITSETVTDELGDNKTVSTVFELKHIETGSIYYFTEQVTYIKDKIARQSDNFHVYDFFNKIDYDAFIESVFKEMNYKLRNREISFCMNCRHSNLSVEKDEETNDFYLETRCRKYTEVKNLLHKNSGFDFTEMEKEPIGQVSLGGSCRYMEEKTMDINISVPMFVITDRISEKDKQKLKKKD